MKCSKHNDVEAIGQCQECGAYVCEKCAEATKYAREDYGILCPECYADRMANAVNIFKKDNKKRLTRIIVSCILYLFGLVAIISGITSEPMMVVVGVIFCGIYTGLTWHKMGEAVHEENERKNGVTYVVTDSGVERKDGFWMKLVFFIIGTIFGVVITPIRCIIDIISINKNKKSIKDLNEAIVELRNL